MRLNFATLSSPPQKAVGQLGTGGTRSIHAGLVRPTFPADAWDTVGHPPGPIVMKQEEVGHLSHLSHPEQNEVGRGEPSVHGAVPLVPPVPPVSGSSATANPDRYCWPHSKALNSAEIDTFTARVHQFIRYGLDSPEAEGLADALVTRDRDADDRRLCLECSHLRLSADLWRCGQWRQAELSGPDVAGVVVTMLQRCAGFNDKVSMSAEPRGGT